MSPELPEQSLTQFEAAPPEYDRLTLPVTCASRADRAMLLAGLVGFKVDDETPLAIDLL